jgi:hypothetical protein
MSAVLGECYDPVGKRWGIPTYPWRWAPEGLATKRQLRALGLRPGGQEPVGQVMRAASPPAAADRLPIPHRPSEARTADDTGQARRARQSDDRAPHLPAVPHRGSLLHSAFSWGMRRVRLFRYRTSCVMAHQGSHPKVLQVVALVPFQSVQDAP